MSTNQFHHTFIIGDIHGCYAELQELIERAALTSKDRIIALGDLVDRGPDSPDVLNFFQQPFRHALMGNHEREHVLWQHAKIKPDHAQQLSKLQFGSNYRAAVRFMETFPLYIELNKAILVHGLFEPDIPPDEQRPNILYGSLSGERRMRKYGKPWYASYHGSKPLIFGHHNYNKTDQPLIDEGRLYGLDTSCVHGMRLTGLLLPEFRIISVPSRENYWQKAQRI